MNKITAEEESLSKLPEIEHHIKALKIFNKLRIQMFGTTLIQGWEKTLKEFNIAYLNIPNISKLPKIHIILSHCEEFINLYGEGKGLGYFFRTNRRINT